ncbi:MAG: tetratricopeptide repeat protein [Lachnospiraceae bacterium]|jgi:predicted Zn-dependent protease|nr:tetratricopeptide repeat protein [Lachnospiraceae bacterium]
MNYKQKLKHQSDGWYNDGLKRAKIHDLTGAISSLKKSLQYNGSNTPARNLLGLVYYGRGEIVEALVEWILSKNLQVSDNIANYYIKNIQESKEELEIANNAIKRYNQALNYANEGSEDLAVIYLQKVIDTGVSFVKAYQLLALLFIDKGQLKKARKLLKLANKIDKTDPITLELYHELHLSSRRNQGRLKENNNMPEAVTGEHAIEYKVGNETIIQPKQNYLKSTVKRLDIGNIIIGMILASLIMVFLILPQVTKLNNEKTNKDIINLSDQIEVDKSQIAAMKTQLEEYRANDASTKSETKSNTGVKDSYELLMSVNTHFAANDMSDKDMVADLIKINKSALGEDGLAIYKKITDEVYPRYSSSLYGECQSSYENGNYDNAKTSLEIIYKINPNLDNGNAMLLYGNTLVKLNQTKEAKVILNEVIEKNKGTDAGTKATEELSKLK